LLETLSSRTSWKAILVAMFGAQGGTSVSLYTSIVYMLYFLQTVLKVEPMQANLCLGVGILIAAPLYPVFGKLSDIFGRARVMLIGIVMWIAAAFPAFVGIKAGVASAQWISVSLLIALLAVLTAMIMAPLPAFVAESFPPQARTTGFGLAQQLGNVMFGGFLPLISLSLVNLTGNPLAGVGYSIASLLPCLVVTWIWGLKQDARMRNVYGGGMPAHPAAETMTTR
jgi:MFS family permease